jgi:hypothetical protein
MSPRELLRMIAGYADWYVASLLLADESIAWWVHQEGRITFGSGREWGHADASPAGLLVYVQGPPATRAVIPWQVLRDVRQAADPQALAALRAAIDFGRQGPRYYPDRLPADLVCTPYGERDDEWFRRAREAHVAWEADHHLPYLRREAEARARRRAALTAVFAAPPSDLLDLLAEMTA